MRRFVPLAFAILLNTCGPTLAPAHPAHLAWEHSCPPYDPKWEAQDEQPDPNEHRVSYYGIFDFCKTEPDAVLCHGHPGGALPLLKVLSIDAKLRAQFQYRDDMQLYPKVSGGDWWAGYTICGDCEDYALTLSEMLADAGEGGEHMRFSLETVETGDGHATLLIDTSDAGVIEASVGDYPPSAYKADPRRDGTIKMDGKLDLVPEPGYVLDMHTQLIERIKK